MDNVKQNLAELLDSYLPMWEYNLYVNELYYIYVDGGRNDDEK